jgi:hypothetical protein
MPVDRHARRDRQIFDQLGDGLVTIVANLGHRTRYHARHRRRHILRSSNTEGTGSCKCFIITIVGESPENGTCPTSISKRITPSE